MRELALPGVRHLPAAGHELVAPGEFRVLEPAARRELPLGLGRKRLIGPARIRLGVAVGDVHDGVVVEPLDRRCPGHRVCAN